jgi:hypothetical protein
MNNMVLQTIIGDDTCDSLRINQDIDISPFSKIRTFKFADCNHTFTPAIIHDAGKKAERDRGQSQQCSMEHQTHRIVVKIISHGIINR